MRISTPQTSVQVSGVDGGPLLTAPLSEQRKQVEKSEAALQKYREANNRISTENSQNIVVQKLTNLNSAVTTAKTERINKEALYRQLQSVRQEPAAIQSFPAVMSNPYIQRLKSELRSREAGVQLASELGDRFGAGQSAVAPRRSKAKLRPRSQTCRVDR